MQFQKVSLNICKSRSFRRFGAALVLLSAATAMADEVPSDVVDSPQRKAFLAGTTNNCPGCDLRDVSLKRRDLSGADLTGADLSGATLHAARLTNAKLSHAKLHEANLNKADLKHADLTEADLTEALLVRRRSEWRPA